MAEARSTENIFKNINELSRRIDISEEQKAISLRMLAEHSVSELSLPELEEVYSTLLSSCDSLTTSDKITFFQAVSHSAKLADVGRLLSLFGEAHSAAGTHGKIAVVRNTYNDLACDKFSASIPHPKPIYYNSFEECCEAVAYDVCEFTLIPIENTSDGRMFGFYSLIDRYELKICSVCTLEDDDTSRLVRYALISKSMWKPNLERSHEDMPRIFEFSLTFDFEDENLGISRAASLCNAKLYRASTLPLPYNDMIRFYYSFKINKLTDLKAFLLYLWFEYPRYTAIGIYKEI